MRDKCIDSLISDLNLGNNVIITTEEGVGIIVGSYPETVRILKQALLKIKEFHEEEN